MEKIYNKEKVILVQGAMDIEIEYLKNSLENVKRKSISDYEFYIGNFKENKDREIIISKTLIGTINASIATCIGIENFKPDLVINQGIAGSHKESIHTGDIIIGNRCANINSYSMPEKEKYEGSNPFEWKVDKRARSLKKGNTDTINKVKNFLEESYTKNIYVGILGSGDVFNREVDRIEWIQNKFGNLSEDMESIGVYSVCERFNIPCIGIRIISNNEITKEKLDENQAYIVQRLLVEFLKQEE